MKKLLILITITLSNPVFAACPIDNEGAACLAEFQKLNIPALPEFSPQMPNTPSAGDFSETPATVDSSREIQPKKNLRSFGANSQDFGYNSNCQFGVCLDRGMPRIFPEEK